MFHLTLIGITLIDSELILTAVALAMGVLSVLLGILKSPKWLYHRFTLPQQSDGFVGDAHACLILYASRRAGVSKPYVLIILLLSSFVKGNLEQNQKRNQIFKELL